MNDRPTPPNDLGSLLKGLDDTQIEAVALAAASAFEGVVGAYERVSGWSAALYHPPTRDTLVVDGLPTRRAALEALILEHHDRSA